MSSKQKSFVESLNAAVSQILGTSVEFGGFDEESLNEGSFEQDETVSPVRYEVVSRPIYRDLGIFSSVFNEAKVVARYVRSSKSKPDHVWNVSLMLRWEYFELGSNGAEIAVWVQIARNYEGEYTWDFVRNKRWA